MSNIINLPTYEQVDKMQTELNNAISINGGTDWSKYTPTRKNITIKPSASSVYQKAFEKKGKGYISKGLLALSSGNGAFGIKFKIDDKEYEFRNTVNSGFSAGIVQSSDVTLFSDGLKSSVGNTVKSIQAVGDLTVGLISSAGVVINQPFFFERSLEISIYGLSSDYLILELIGGEFN